MFVLPSQDQLQGQNYKERPNKNKKTKKSIMKKIKPLTNVFPFN